MIPTLFTFLTIFTSFFTNYLHPMLNHQFKTRTELVAEYGIDRKTLICILAREGIVLLKGILSPEWVNTVCKILVRPLPENKIIICFQKNDDPSFPNFPHLDRVVCL